MQSWLQSLTAPVGQLYDSFSANRNNNIYNLAHNSQVVYLQAVLNDTFDNVSRGIYITDGSIFDPLYTYLVAENQPLWLGLSSEVGSTSYPDPQWLFRNSETTYSGFLFIVMVPSAVVYDVLRMRALIDKFRLPSKSSYQIVTY